MAMPKGTEPELGNTGSGNVSLVLQNASENGDVKNSEVPSEESFLSWVVTALQGTTIPYEVTIRLVDEKESQILNTTYRNKKSATNVLSFPSEIEKEILSAWNERSGHQPLGDLAICMPVVSREAMEQGKPVFDHWAHLVIHGVLHLLGHDHSLPDQAVSMENLEKELLAKLGIDDPYLIN
jgi:probable rRNA maturation factor